MALHSTKSSIEHCAVPAEFVVCAVVVMAVAGTHSKVMQEEEKGTGRLQTAREDDGCVALHLAASRLPAPERRPEHLHQTSKNERKISRDLREVVMQPFARCSTPLCWLESAHEWSRPLGGGVG